MKIHKQIFSVQGENWCPGAVDEEGERVDVEGETFVEKRC